MITSERLECIEHRARVLNESVTLELITEIRRLRSLCEEAVAEIESQWDAHCEDGYGPRNLQLRLRQMIGGGYASPYLIKAATQIGRRSGAQEAAKAIEELKGYFLEQHRYDRYTSRQFADAALAKIEAIGEPKE